MIETKKSISVLIANFNWPVSTLIKTLHTQLQKANVQFEILCFDDALKNDFRPENELLNALPNVQYRVNETNLGRSKNRNALAEAAQHNFYLFLDGDSAVENPDFVANYLSAAHPDQVVCGGTAYYKSPPKNQRHLLRYIYGKNREQRSANDRQSEPWQGFSAFNFFIPANIFHQLTFDDSITKYGHEDTLFGNALKYRCISILHINNAAIHLGLDDAEVFLAKTRKSVENIRHLIDDGLIDEDVKLYAWYAKMKKFMLAMPIKIYFSLRQKKWEKQLCGAHPSLKIFDLYKLGYLFSLPINHRQPPKRKI